MTLFKRGNVWWAYFAIDGRRHQESTGTSNRRLAEQVHKKLQESANLKRFQIAEYNSKITFRQIADQFIASGASFFNQDRLKHLLPFFGEMPVREITRNKANEYRIERKRVNPALRESTLDRDIGVLRRVLNWAAEAQFIPVSPLVRPPMVYPRRIPKPVLSVAEENQLLAAIKKPHLKALVIAALDTGMRRGELLGQRWEHVDLEPNVLSVSRSKTPEGEGREIPLTGRVAELLATMKRDSEFVFTYLGRPIFDAKTAWNTAQRKAKLSRHFRFHDLRHTFATRMMEAGVVSDIRRALMGHVDRSVHATYVHIELPMKRAAIAKLEQWVDAERQRLKNP